MQSGTGVSRKPSESVFCGWFYDVREERRPGTDPQKSVTGFRFGGRGRGRPENIVQKPAKFSRFFRCLQIFQIFRSIVVSFFSYHLSRTLRPVFGKTIEKHVSRLQNTNKKNQLFLKNWRNFDESGVFSLKFSIIFRQCSTTSPS